MTERRRTDPKLITIKHRLQPPTAALQRQPHKRREENSDTWRCIQTSPAQQVLKLSYWSLFHESSIMYHALGHNVFLEELWSVRYHIITI